MADNRKVAGGILDTAKKVIMTERGSTHGDAENSFAMIGALWSAYLNHVHLRQTGNYPNIVITGFDVAQMMVQLKQSRAVYGEQFNLDHYVDGAGYQALAGMLASSGVAAQVDEAIKTAFDLAKAEVEAGVDHAV